ncbi:MAG TPA: fasciclin domain-containing protein [Puia sp.]|uniref:fasciclin domain-containing protein n=1 Tax=Puia sp. TaxID=2045100 RepID=UPI002B631F29|nr:fasciclin domain-containing protein [Puia sp.]HVU94869.1 fasciclin domain-containing protein [Puia sp.]
MKLNSIWQQRTAFSLALPVIAATLFLTQTACKKNHDNPTPSPATITQTVTTDTSFSLLAGGLGSAGLTTTLSGPGPFTVFAPNNAAFAASGLTASALASIPAATLKTILLYHVLPSKVPAAQVPSGPNAKVVTASGDSVFVTNNTNGVFVNGIKVVKADVAASNGVIHVLAKVLIPPAGNLVQTAQADTNFSYLVAAVTRASQGSTNVAAILSGGGIFTVFAPTNAAFRAAGFATINDINAADPATLTKILTYHVIPGRAFSSDLTDGAKVMTANGESLTISLSAGAKVKGMTNSTASNIIATNIMATNGVVHVIDQVLLP